MAWRFARSGSLWAASILGAWVLVACASSEDADGSGSGGDGGAGNSAGVGNGGSWASGGSGGAGGSAGAAAGGAPSGGAAGSGATTSGGSGGAVSSEPCAGASDGKHCGSELSGGADHLTLYTCAAGTTSSATACSYGCASGACNQPPSDPCASAGGNGAYCGTSLSGGDANKLYTCSGGKTTGTISCSGGCQSNPPGTPDACASSDPCTGAYAGNGKYCGKALPGGDPNKLYTCNGGATTGALTCTGGCVEMPAGTPDACASGDPCKNANGGNGPYCGGSIGGDASTLYTCTNQQTTATQVCAGGCQVNPPGTPDACKSGSTDPCTSSSGNGEFCGSTLTGGDSSKLYTCLSKKTASTVTCSSGCKVNPPGTPDQCASSGPGGCCVQKPPGAWQQGFSANCSANTGHFGIDYSANTGTPIYAGISGAVKIVTGYPNCYDSVTQSCSTTCYQTAFNYLRIKADCGDPKNSANDLYVYYLHINKAASGLTDGAKVKQGDYVADVGNSGCSSGSHTHIEVVSVPKGTSPKLHSCYSKDPAGYYCP